MPWDWKSFGEYLDKIDGTLAPNAGFLVGHSTIRRVVMGERATQEEATPEDLAAMEQLLAESLAAGGLGFSSSWARTHNDAEGDMVPSRYATEDELIALCKVVSRFPGTTLEFIPCVGQFEDYAADLMTRMSLAADRPLNWNVLFVSAANMDMAEHNLAASDYAPRTRRQGARPDDARRAVAPHLLRQRLPARHDPRLAEADDAPARREEGDARERRGPRRARGGVGRGQGTGRHRELADLHHQRDVRAGEQAVRRAQRRRHREGAGEGHRSTRSSTSWWPTT